MNRIDGKGIEPFQMFRSNLIMVIINLLVSFKCNLDNHCSAKHYSLSRVLNYLSSIPRKGKIHIEVSSSLCLTPILFQEQTYYNIFSNICQELFTKKFYYIVIM